MSDELDSSTSSVRTGKRSNAPLSPEMRERKQKKFLKAFAETGNVKHSCKIAGIDRSLYYYWRDNDEDFKAQLPDVLQDANDTLEFAAYERAVQGIEEPVVSQGQLVYEYEQVVDETTGKFLFADNGKPLLKRVRQVTKRVYSDSLLTTLLKARLPEKYRDRQSVELTGKGGGPLQVQRHKDLALLTDEELAQVEQTLRQAREREGQA